VSDWGAGLPRSRGFRLARAFGWAGRIEHRTASRGVFPGDPGRWAIRQNLWSQKTSAETPDHNSDAVKIDDRIAPSRPIIVKEAVGDRVPGVVAKGPVV
jgi:hypothetical protein